MPSTMKNIIQCAVNNALNRNVKWMDTTILIYALSRSDSEARRILSDGGIDYEDAYQYLKRFDNEPLKEGEKPRFTPTALRLVEYVNSPLALLRAIQRTDCDGRGLPASAGRNDVFGDVGERRLHPKTGLYNIVKPPACFVCVYASVCIWGCIQKKPGKSPKTLIYKGKNKIPFSCMHCMHQYMGFPSFFSNPL